jgi:hypothetical protein
MIYDKIIYDKIIYDNSWKIEICRTVLNGSGW